MTKDRDTGTRAPNWEGSDGQRSGILSLSRVSRLSLRVTRLRTDVILTYGSYVIPELFIHVVKDESVPSKGVKVIPPDFCLPFKVFIC